MMKLTDDLYYPDMSQSLKVAEPLPVEMVQLKVRVTREQFDDFKGYCGHNHVSMGKVIQNMIDDLLQQERANLKT